MNWSASAGTMRGASPARLSMTSPRPRAALCAVIQPECKKRGNVLASPSSTAPFACDKPCVCARRVAQGKERAVLPVSSPRVKS
jgi:hypothetical protein